MLTKYNPKLVGVNVYNIDDITGFELFGVNVILFVVFIKLIKEFIALGPVEPVSP